MKYTRLVALGASAAIVLAACGGDDNSSSTTKAAETTAAAETAAPAETTATAETTAATKVTVNANTATADEIKAALEANGVPSADRWTDEILEYRPYPTDDPTFAKLRGELSKYNPAPEVLDGIIASLTL